MNELISAEIARKAGVPAARCTHALVKLNGRDLGLYVLKEAYTKEFLAEFYRDTSGDLYDGGSADVSEKTAKQRGDGKDTKDLKALRRAACAEADDAKRWEKLGAILDVERFINYLALENVLVHWDSYSSNRNNYRLYKDPATGKFSFILHGMDQTLAFPDHALVQPKYVGMVSRAVMSTPGGETDVSCSCKGSVGQGLEADRLGRPRGGHRRKKHAEALALKHPDRAKEFEGSINTVKERVAARIKGVEKQLAAIPKPARSGNKGD